MLLVSQVTDVLSQLLDIWLEKVSTDDKLIKCRFTVKRSDSDYIPLT